MKLNKYFVLAYALFFISVPLVAETASVGEYGAYEEEYVDDVEINPETGYIIGNEFADEFVDDSEWPVREQVVRSNEKLVKVVDDKPTGTDLETKEKSEDSEENEKTEEVVPSVYIDKSVAVLKVMDKAAGKVKDLKIPVGTELKHEKLSLLVRSCKQTEPFKPEDFFTFIEIRSGQKKIFSGWMSRNEPGVNPLQDSDYDVWLVKCD